MVVKKKEKKLFCHERIMEIAGSHKVWREQKLKNLKKGKTKNRLIFVFKFFLFFHVFSLAPFRVVKFLVFPRSSKFGLSSFSFLCYRRSPLMGIEPVTWPLKIGPYNFPTRPSKHSCSRKRRGKKFNLNPWQFLSSFSHWQFTLLLTNHVFHFPFCSYWSVF